MKFKFTKKKVIIAIGVIALCAVKYNVFAKSNKAPTGAPVNTAEITKGTIEEIINFRAPLEGTETAEVVSKLHYEVLDIYVKEGDHVTKGQKLATLDSETLNDEIQSARDDLSLLKLRKNEDLNTKQKTYDEYNANLKKAEEDLARVKELFEAGGETQVNLDAAQKNVDDIKRDMETIKINDGKAVNDAVDNKEIEIKQKSISIISKKLEDCNIVSPIDGTITRVNINKGRFADDTDDDKPMFVIENLEKLSMTVPVSEYDIAKVKVGQEVEISADFLGEDTVKGVVKRISPTGEEKQGSTERIIPIEIEVTEKNDKLIAGINVKAKMVVNSAENAFIVPIECLYQDETGANSLMVVKPDGTIHIVPVETGVEDDISIQVISANNELNEKDRIIMLPDASMTEGMAVTDLNKVPDEATDGSADSSTDTSADTSADGSADSSADGSADSSADKTEGQ